MEKSLLIGDHLFVSKIAYGPRMPNTPVAVPFTQNTLPGTNSKSWSDILHRPYKRLAGLDKVKNNDPVVFNFPAGDTVVTEDQVTSYYEIVRSKARDLKERDYKRNMITRGDGYYLDLARRDIRDRFHIIYRPVDRRDNYVKRCIAIPGDTILIRAGTVFINGKKLAENNTQQTTYKIKTNRSSINPKSFESLNISISDQHRYGGVYVMPLTKKNSEIIAGFSNIIEVKSIYAPAGEYDPSVFPYKESLRWNIDNFGPLWIPSAGSTVKIDTSNICFYERIIDVYENNDLRIEGSKIYINNTPADSYTFKMDYYWMMGDNRHRSSDSRIWGFVPADHIVGKPGFIWLSLNNEASGLKKIRFGRIFKGVE
ncbi:MAG: S26 family signal peptidase [Bacteroidetes bacterium]|nr:S26 family signal peptidase [Bacteroidota bacterium]